MADACPPWWFGALSSLSTGTTRPSMFDMGRASPRPLFEYRLEMYAPALPFSACMGFFQKRAFEALT